MDAALEMGDSLALGRILHWAWDMITPQGLLCENPKGVSIA